LTADEDRGAPTAGQGAATPLLVRSASDPATWLVVSGRAQGSTSWEVGDGDPSSARAAALGPLGLAPESLVLARQVHGARVVPVGAADRGRGARGPDTAVPDADALVTTAEEVAVGVLVADCVPVALVAPARGVAAVHAGRGGVVAGVVGAAVAALVEETGSRPGDLEAIIGPGIGGCCYEVPASLAREVAMVVPRARTTTQAGTRGLDLPAAVDAQLQAAGVSAISAIGSCTRCDHERWFSHRATGAGAAAPGRQLLAIARTAVPPSQPPASLQSPS